MDQENVIPIKDDVEITAELNPGELEAEWEKLAERARFIHPVIKMGVRTDLGKIRENNEDKFDFFEPEDPEVLAKKGMLYAVADGMGGHAAGQIASEMAQKTIIKSYYADPSPDVRGSLIRAVFEANSLIFDAAQAITERSGMGTTYTGVVIRGDTAFFVHVGDSRGYLIRDGKIRQVTEDHSWVAEQVRRGAISEEEAKYSPFRNVITRSLGNMPTVDVDIYAEAIKPGDMIVLCSDGLTGSLSDEEILSLTAGKSPSQAAVGLVDMANERGGTDNITTVVLSVKDIIYEEGKAPLDEGQPEEENPPRKKGFLGLFGK